jgi:hypothetical protein
LKRGTGLTQGMCGMNYGLKRRTCPSPTPLPMAADAEAEVEEVVEEGGVRRAWW